MEFELRELSADDSCNALSLGDEEFRPLKTFLRKDAKRLHLGNLARTFVLVEQDKRRVYAYITTVCTHIAVEKFTAGNPVDDENYRYDDYPAVKLARLAVDESLKLQSIGSQLVDFVVGLAIDFIMPHAGCRFMVVDAKAKSVAFYLKKGFVRVGEPATEAIGAEPVSKNQTRPPDQAAGAAEAADRQHTTMFIDLHRLPAAQEQASQPRRYTLKSPARN